MKFISFLNIFLVFTILQTKAQKFIEVEIFFEHDTVIKQIESPVYPYKKFHYSYLQDQITYKDSSGKRRRLKPHEILGFTFKEDDKTVKMLSEYIYSLGRRVGTTNKPNTFVRVEEEGPLTLFSYYDFVRYPPAPLFESIINQKFDPKYYFLQKKNTPVKQLQGNFKKRMCVFFNDCPRLVNKIATKEFTKNDIRLIVQFYNKHCVQF